MMHHLYHTKVFQTWLDLIDESHEEIDMFIQWGIYEDGNGVNIYNHLLSGKILQLDSSF